MAAEEVLLPLSETPNLTEISDNMLPIYFDNWESSIKNDYMFRDRVEEKTEIFMELGESWIVETLREEGYYVCVIIHKEMVTDDFIETLKILQDSEKRLADEKLKHIDFRAGYENSTTLLIVYMEPAYESVIKTFVNTLTAHNVFKAWNDRVKIELTFLKKLGSGAFGKVFTVERKQSGHIYACKVIEKTLLDGKKTKILKHEVETLILLSHENIIEYKKGYETKKYVYLVMELCSGGDMSAFLKQVGRLSEKISVIYIKQILEALVYVHGKGFIHSDLKPANLMFVSIRRRIVKLIDFGLSKDCNHRQWLEKAGGTPKYLAPEILKKHYNYEMDLWSVGIMAFEMLFGYTPFNKRQKGNNIGCVVQALNEGFIPKELPGKGNWFNKDIYITSDAKNFIKTLLQRNPGKRYTAVEALSTGYILGDNDKSVSANILNAFQQVQNMNIMIDTFPCHFGVKYLSSFDLLQINDFVVKMEREHAGKVSKNDMDASLGSLTYSDGVPVDTDVIFKALHKHKAICVHDHGTSKNDLIPTRTFLELYGILHILLSDDRIFDALKRIDKEGTGKITFKMLEPLIENNKSNFNAIEIENLKQMFGQGKSYNAILEKYFVHDDSETLMAAKFDPTHESNYRYDNFTISQVTQQNLF